MCLNAVSLTKLWDKIYLELAGHYIVETKRANESKNPFAPAYFSKKATCWKTFSLRFFYYVSRR